MCTYVTLATYKYWMGIKKKPAELVSRWYYIRRLNSSRPEVNLVLNVSE